MPKSSKKLSRRSAKQRRSRWRWISWPDLWPTKASWPRLWPVATNGFRAASLRRRLTICRTVILQEQGASEDAIRSLRSAVYLDSNLVVAHFALGNIARRRGRYSEADKHLGLALRLSGHYREDEVLPESDGITAGRFAQIIHSLMGSEATA